MPPAGLSSAPDASPSTDHPDAPTPLPQERRSFGAGLATTWLGLAPVLWLALALRLHRLDGQSLWSDEGISAVMAGRSVPDILINAAGDVHPPLYYLLLRGWAGLVGTSEVGLRSLSVWFGVLTVAAGYVLARRLFGRGAALTTAALLSISPYLIHYSQEARMYAPLAAWATFTLYGAARLATDARPSLWPVAGYAVAAAALGLTQYFGVAYLLAALIGFALLCPPLRRNARRWRMWLAGNAVALTLALPWALYVVPHVAGLATGGAAPGRRAWLTLAVQTLTFGRAAPLMEPGNLWAIVGVVAAAGAGLLTLFLITAGVRRWTHLQRTTVLLVACLLPVAALYLLTTRRALSFPEYMKLLLPVIPPAAGLLAAGLTGLGLGAARQVQRVAAAQGAPTVAGAVGVVVVAAAVAPALAAYYSDPRLARDDYRGLVEHVARNIKEGDAIILDAPEQTEIFNYYARGNWEQYPLPSLRPIDDAATRRQLEAIAGQHRRAWVVLWAWQEADPRRVVETWLNAHAFRTADRWYGSVQLALYTIPQVGERGLVAQIDADFGDGAVLEQAEFPSAGSGGVTAQPGSSIAVTLLWRAETTPGRRYSAFVHLTDDERVPWAQHDSEPGGGTALTTTWKPGEAIADRHGLSVPPATPPGHYSLIAGLYDTVTGIRQTPRGAGARGDVALLGNVTIARSDPPPVAALPIRTRLALRLGPLEIIGADLEPVGANGAGGDLKAQSWADVLLHWRAAARPDRPYRVALSLRQGDREVARQERPPAPQFPTDQWETGEIVRDQRRLLLAIPPGAYRLIAELLAEDGVRIAAARLPDVVVEP